MPARSTITRSSSRRSGGGGGNVGTINLITSTGATLTITNPSGPTVNLEVAGIATRWSALTAPIANLGLTMAAFTSTFTYNAATGAGANMFTLRDTASNTGTGALMSLETAALSAAIPLKLTARGGVVFNMLATGEIAVGASAVAVSGVSFTMMGTYRMGGVTYTAPAAAPAANGYVRTATTAGVESWTNPALLGVAWSSLTAPTANLALAMSAFTSTFTYSAATGAGVNMFALTDTAGNTGTGALMSLATAATSNAQALKLTIRGAVVFTQDATLGNIGVGSSTAPTGRLHVFADSTNTGTSGAFKITGSNVTYAASGEHIDVDWIFGTETVTSASGATNNWRVFRITPPVIAATGARTFRDAQTLDISSAPQAGTGITIERAHAIRTRGGNVAVSDSVTIGTTDYNKGTSGGNWSSMLIVNAAGDNTATLTIDAAANATLDFVWFTGEPGANGKFDFAATAPTTVTKLSVVHVDSLDLSNSSGFAITVTDISSFTVDGAPTIFGADLTYTNAYAAWFRTGKVGIGTNGNATAGTLRFNGITSGYTEMTAAAATTSVSYTLPSAAPLTTGMTLSSTTAGVMSWTDTPEAYIPWSSLLPPTGTQLLNMGNEITSFTWGAATGGGNTMFTLVDTGANTGTGYILSIDRAGTSNAKPFRARNGNTILIDTNSSSEVGLGIVPASGVRVKVGGPVATSGSPITFQIAPGAHTTLAASTEASDVAYALNRTVQFATGALTTQRAFQIAAPTYGFVAASVLTNTATVAISGAPVAGTNATLTNTYALWIETGRLALGTAGNATAGTLRFNGVTSGFTEITAAAATTSVSYTLPAAAAGANGYVLTSTTAGVWSWTDPTTITTAPTIWNSIGNPTGDQTLTMGNRRTFWVFGGSTGSGSMFFIGDTASNSGTGAMLWVETNTSSAAPPLKIAARGTAVMQTLSTGEFSIGASLAPIANFAFTVGKMAVGGGAWQIQDATDIGGSGSGVGIWGSSDSTTGLNINNYNGPFRIRLSNGGTPATTAYFARTGEMAIGPSHETPVAMLDILQKVSTTGSPQALLVTGAAHTTLTASTEATSIYFNLAQTVQFATGALTTQRAIRIAAPTYAFVAASTITDAATVYINGAPTAGTNATITNNYALWVDAGLNRFDGNGTHVFELPADVTAAGAYKGRIPVVIGGSTQYLHYFDA